MDLGQGFEPMQISGGMQWMCSVSTNNEVKCWGNMLSGDPVGDGANEMGDNLQQIELGSDFTPARLESDTYHTCVVSDANQLKCWGMTLELQTYKLPQ